MVLVVNPGVIDFGEIVVLGGQPEYRDRIDSLRGQPLGQPYGRQRFVNGVGGTGEKADLLAGDYGNRTRPAQSFEKWTVAILFPQRGHQGRPPLVRKIDLARRFLVGFAAA